jgi:putative nucleotidyltransferase-like protein
LFIAAIFLSGMSTTAKPRPIQAAPPERERPPSRGSHPEFDLLTACCATAWRPTEHGNIERLLRSELHWEKLLRSAEHHGLTSRLLECLEISSRHVPREAMDSLRATYRQNAYRRLWFAHELGRIVENLRSAGVRVLAHKGPTLSVMLYGDVAQRQFHDLDFLVMPGDVAKTTNILRDMGYQPDMELDTREDEAHLGSGYERVFHSLHGKNLLEVQWRVLPRFYAIDFDMRKMFARSQDIKVGTQLCTALGSEDLLLALCVHAAKHVWTQMSWLRDITQLTLVRGLDWDFIAREAARLGIRRIMALNFLLADRLFECGIPKHIEPWTDDPATHALLPELMEIMQRGVAYQTESFAYFRLMMQLRERRRERMRLLWRLASTPGIGEWKSVRLPGVLFPMYSLVRVGRLAKRLSVAP